MKIDQEALQGYLSDAFQHKQELINIADTKANILLGLVGVILALFFRFVVGDASGLTLSSSILFVLVPFITSGALALFVIYPRTSKKKQPSPLGLGKADQKIFVDNVSELEIETMAKDYDQITNALAGVANKKFKYLRLAYLFFAIGIVAKTIIELSIISG